LDLSGDLWPARTAGSLTSPRDVMAMKLRSASERPARGAGRCGGFGLAQNEMILRGTGFNPLHLVGGRREESLS
jgi:hypothetical protein